ncbi:hypothetical protein AA0113_g10638 [Alternaria arborescens]|uniref:Uncharacterized protein n=1 Tax=Alternaria arborescens TaxID=156630 RepID=A0A4Q4QNC0_9PLEO|nr:hypothetical protein AA0113_g10638 [Alternaria arborescens]
MSSPSLLEVELVSPDAAMYEAATIMAGLRHARTSTSASRPGLKLKLTCIQSALHPSPLPIAGAGHKRKFTHHEDDVQLPPIAPSLPISIPTMKRLKRILDPQKTEHAVLIAAATKDGAEYYDSDASDVAGDVKDTTKPELFRNVTWGAYATSYDNDADFQAQPESTQFVPGRFELLADGTVRDQKHKLVIKLLDKNRKKRIFANPPPRDWASQEAITALNKRTVQQIRRNTSVRFREVVQAYVQEERTWILANLTNGKPTKGWKTFVEEFNKTFAGRIPVGAAGARPVRSHSSLTKEVERFGAEFYTKGLIPVPAKKEAKKG